jgi:hypothetical protein
MRRLGPTAGIEKTDPEPSAARRLDLREPVGKILRKRSRGERRSSPGEKV